MTGICIHTLIGLSTMLTAMLRVSATGISQGMADGPTLRSKSTGRCNKRPTPFGTWNLEVQSTHAIYKDK